MTSVTERVAGLRVAARGRRDARSLGRRHPALAPDDATFAALLRALEPAHADYVRTVSDTAWGVSLPTAAYLYHLCRATSPARLLDTGSGFSSYVLRRHVQEAGRGTVVSADDDADWLARTAGFLQRHGLATDGLLALTAAPLARGAYVLALHDLPICTARGDALPAVATAVAGGGIALLDDGHHYGGEIFAAGRAASLELYSLRARTLDPLGRYAILGIA